MTEPKEVNDFHAKSDVDSSPFAHHHTLGRGRNQAAQGDHRHIFPRAKLIRTTNQSVASGSQVAISWESAEYQEGGIFWSSGSTLTIPEDGVYIIGAGVQFGNSAAATNVRALVLYSAEFGYIFAGDYGAGATVVNNHGNNKTVTSPPTYFTAGQTFDVRVRQDSGAAMDLQAGAVGDSVGVFVSVAKVGW